MKWPVGRIIQWSAEYLAKKRVDTPLLNLEVLLAHVLNIDRTTENARLNNCKKQICFQKAKLFGELKSDPDKNKFDFIVSNPPYIPSDEIETLAPEIKDYEPRVVLDRGSDGLDFYRKIMSGVSNYLNKVGFIIF